MENLALDNLSEKEKEYLLKVLKELTEKGHSKLLDDLKYADFNEIPVDIETFLKDDNYLGYAWKDDKGNSKLFDTWLKFLRELFPDNVSTSVNTAIFSGARGLGKAQPLDSPVLTTNGFKRMGDISFTDKVYGEDGKPHQVLGIFPQGEKAIYRVTFSDGSSTECSKEHLWTIKGLENTQGFKTVELGALIDKALIRSQKHQYFIPITAPVDFPHNELLIAPYLMGCFLSGGDPRKQVLALTSQDQDMEIINRCNSTLKEGYTFTVPVPTLHSYRLTRKKEKGTRRPSANIYKEEIKRLGLSARSTFKHIPKEYLFNDIDSRVALLQGLMDIGGHIDENSEVSFITESETLKQDFVWLVESLGGVVKTKERQGTYFSSYILTIQLPRTIEPFFLSSKKAQLNLNAPEPYRAIDKIEYVGEKDCQCIYIDSINHLYLTDHFIVTHNSEIAVAIMAYLMYRVMCLKNPLEYYHLKPTEKFCFAFINIKLEAAEEIANSKFQNTVKMSPWFLNRGTISGRKNKQWVPPDYIDIIIGSQPDDLVGLPIFACFSDEVSFQRVQSIEKQKKKAIDIIDTAIGGMKTRFLHKGKNPTLLILASSKRSEKSFLEEHIKTKLKTEKSNVLILDKPVWEVRPASDYSGETFKVALGNKFLPSLVIPDEDKNLASYIDKGYKILDVPTEFKTNFQENIERALCDYAGISSSEISKYISGAAVSSCRVQGRQNPFVQDIIKVGNDPEDKTQYYDYFDLSKVPKDLKSKPLFVHLDMSVSGDKTGIVGVWIKGKKPSVENLDQANDLYFSLAFSVAVEAPKGYQVSFEKNKNFIYWLKEKGFRIRGVSSDSFQSVDTGQVLTSKGYNYKMISVDRVDNQSRTCLPYQYLRTVFYERRIDTYYSELLTQELIDLEKNINTGKIDHPENGCFTGDTKVSLVDGRDLTFTELVREHEQGKVNYVYSVNHEHKRIQAKRINKAWLTRKDAELVEVTLNNNEVIRCTPNHKFMLKDGSYVEAQDLSLNASLMPLYKDMRGCVSEGAEPEIFNTTGKEKEYLNYRVISIKHLNYTEDVYDLEVADNHNFALTCGVFVHNSKDVSDGLAGATFHASFYAEEFEYDYGDSLEMITQANTDKGLLLKESIAQDLQKTLTETFNPLREQGREKPADDHYMDFGFGKAQTINQNYLTQGIVLW